MLQEEFELPIPLCQEDQNFIFQLKNENFTFPSVNCFIKAAKILQFWPEEKLLGCFLTIFSKQNFEIWNDEAETLELPFEIFCILYEAMKDNNEKKIVKFLPSEYQKH